MKTTIEETYRLTNKHTGRDAGLIVLQINESGGPAIKEVQLLPLNGWMIEAAELTADFVKRMEVCPHTRRRFAPVAMNDRGAA